MNKVPVLVLAFNRADHVKEAMKAIREYKPDRLYLECDGARPNKEGERETVDATRKAMLEAVDWPCEVKTLFREENLGCANAVFGAISWFFENEPWGVIVEDDILLSHDFFKLCEDLLPRYKDNDQVMVINAMNPIYDVHESCEYCFGCCESCWGWASWSRAWAKMDMNMEGANTISFQKLFPVLGIFRSLMTKKYWKGDVQRIRAGNCNSWATRWNYTVIKNAGLVISPKVNLAKNIGTDGGTHYSNGDADPYAKLKIGKLKWPIYHPLKVESDPLQLKRDNNDFFRIRMIGLRKKIKKFFHL